MRTNSPVNLATHLADSVHQGRRRYHKRLTACHENFSRSAVHHLRTQTRRILALLQLVDSLRLSDPTPKLLKRLKKRLDSFGDLRDTQVQLKLLEPLWEQFPEAAALKGFLDRREEKLVARAAHKVNHAKFGALNRCLKRVEKNLQYCGSKTPPVPADKAAYAVVRESFNQVVSLKKQVRPTDIATIHQMRVAFKNFRYQVEQLQPFLTGMTDARIERMKLFQSAAGDLHDFDVLLGCLSQAVKKRKVNPGALRNLRGELLRRKQQALASFMGKLDDLFEFKPAPKPKTKVQVRT
jgi:CHAD domain-containing protein